MIKKLINKEKENNMGKNTHKINSYLVPDLSVGDKYDYHEKVKIIGNVVKGDIVLVDVWKNNYHKNKGVNPLDTYVLEATGSAAKAIKVSGDNAQSKWPLYFPSVRIA